MKALEAAGPERDALVGDLRELARSWNRLERPGPIAVPGDVPRVGRPSRGKGRCVMHPAFSEALLRDRRRTLERRLRSAHLVREARLASASIEPVVVRLGGRDDDRALEALAALEGRSVPAGQHLVAEIRGEVVAAVPLGSGPAVADPWLPTRQIVQLLELRARQLVGRRARRPRGVWGAVRGWSRA